MIHTQYHRNTVRNRAHLCTRGVVSILSHLHVSHVPGSPITFGGACMGKRLAVHVHVSVAQSKNWTIHAKSHQRSAKLILRYRLQQHSW